MRVDVAENKTIIFLPNLQIFCFFFVKSTFVIKSNHSLSNQLTRQRYGFLNPVQEMAQATGLPHNIWPSSPPLQHLCRDSDFAFKGESTYTPSVLNHLACHPKIIEAIKILPVAQVLGQAILMRPVEGITTMTTIAEAAIAIFGPELAGLLWIILQILEIGTDPSPSTYSYTFRTEIPYVQWLNQQEREREFVQRQRPTLPKFIGSSSKEQSQLNAQFATIKEQNDEILRLLRDQKSVETHSSQYFDVKYE